MVTGAGFTDEYGEASNGLLFEYNLIYDTPMKI